MWRLVWKNTVSRVGRLVLTALAVIAGAAFLSGVFVFSDTIRATFDRLFANAYASTDAYVRSPNVVEGDFGAEVRERLPSSLVDEIGDVPTVQAAFGDVQGFARIATLDGVDLGQEGPPKFGGAFIDAPESPWQLVDGAAPGPGDVVIDRAAARSGDVRVGDRVVVTAAGGSREFTVSGIATFAGSDTAGGSTWALFDLATAESFVLGLPGSIDAVIVVSDGSLDDVEFAASLEEQLRDARPDLEIEVLTGAEITAENQDAIERGLGFFTTFLTIFAAISLFVGSFIIYNVFSISAAQRQREHALLRAIGASRGQVTRMMFAEALVVGLIGGGLGFAGGVGLAAAIVQLLTASGVGPTDTSLVVTASAAITTIIVGVVVTLVTAIVPSLRAGRTPPLAAMRDVAVDRSAVSRSRQITGVLTLAIAALGVTLGLVSDPLWLGLGVVALFVSLVVLGPLLAAPLARGLQRPLRTVRGVTGEIAARNAASSPKRTALTASALGIGLALLVGVSTLGASVRTSVREAIGEGFTGDYAVTTENDGFGGLPLELSNRLNDLPEVGDALGIGANLLTVVERSEPSVKTVLTLDPVHAAAVLDLPFVEGGWDALDGSSILVSADKAARDGLRVGDVLPATLPDGTSRELSVTGIFDSDVLGNLIVARDLFTDQPLPLFDLQIFVTGAPGVEPGAAAAAIAAVVDDYAAAEFRTRAEFIDAQAAQVDGFLNFIYGLLGMSIFIAIGGIVITLLLAVYERRRELGLVRAIGMTRPQVRSSIRWEAMVTAVLGAAIGVVFGLLLGWIVVAALRDEGLTTFSVAPVSIAVFAIGSVLLAMLAAWFPARRAARADILDAIATT